MFSKHRYQKVSVDLDLAMFKKSMVCIRGGGVKSKWVSFDPPPTIILVINVSRFCRLPHESKFGLPPPPPEYNIAN